MKALPIKSQATGPWVRTHTLPAKEHDGCRLCAVTGQSRMQTLCGDDRVIDREERWQELK